MRTFFVDADRGDRATIPATLGEVVANTYSSGQETFTPATSRVNRNTSRRSRNVFLVEVVTNISTTDIEVDIPSAVDTEAVEETNACSHFIGVTTRSRSTLKSRSEAETSVRDQRVEAIFIVTADHLRNIEEHVSVSVNVLLFGFEDRIIYVRVLVKLTSAA